jgi:hypothetical protein
MTFLVFHLSTYTSCVTDSITVTLRRCVLSEWQLSDHLIQDTPLVPDAKFVRQEARIRCSVMRLKVLVRGINQSSK